MRLQLTAIAPIVSFLVQEADRARVIHLSLEQQYNELEMTQQRHENEKKISLATIQLKEANHQTKMQNFNREQINLKSSLKSTQQRVQVLKDLQMANGGGDSSVLSTTTSPTSTNSHSNNTQHNSESEIIQNLKVDKKRLIQEVKSSRKRLDGYKTQTLQSTTNLNALFGSKLAQEHQDQLAHAIIQHRQTQMMSGHSSQFLNDVNTQTALCQVMSFQLKLPSFEEFIQLSGLGGENGDGKQHHQQQQQQQDFVWDLKQFISIDPQQPYLLIQQQPQKHDMPYGYSNDQNGANSDDDDGGFEVISI